MLNRQLSDLPPLLQSRVEHFLERFRESAPEELNTWLEARLGDPEFSAQLSRVWAGSEFVANTCVRHPEVFRDLVESGDLEADYDGSTLYQRGLLAVAEEAASQSEREATLHRQLRQFRRYQMLRIVWRDLADTNPDGEQKMLTTTREMSLFADAVISMARDKLHRWLSATWGTPMGDVSGVEQHLLVLGMGKLGARELNVSSDIDLIFAYPETGETTGVTKTCSNQEFFIRLAQKLIQALDNTTVDGQVFRVDMRLRPYGSSGALALSFDALEEYYHNQGRDWERYAMIKSRVIEAPGSGGDAAVQSLEQVLRAFTYRRYTDFSVIQSLRDMKGMINLEVERRGLSNNIKLGHGGIREIEFIAQAFQLVWGGRDRRFQQRELYSILRLLDEEQSLPDGAGAGLWEAYVFLRNLEHVLQGWGDQQTQELPGDDGDAEADRVRVAFMMGYADWPAFIEALDEHRERVKCHFQALVADAAEAEDETGNEHAQTAAAPAQLLLLEAAWLNNDIDGLLPVLADLGFDDPQAAAQCLRVLGSSQKIQAMPVETRARLDSLMPRLILACAGMENSAEALSRVLQLVESVARRSAYLVLLIENAQALQQLVKLCAASPWISQSLGRHPVLLDELLDPRSLYQPPDRQQMADALRQQMLRVPEDDLEAQMEALRHFRLAQGLQVAACEVMEVLPLMKVSDHLTWLAEVILDEVLQLAWQQITARHGFPARTGTGQSAAEPAGFLILGYGKLGGIELAHGSDLDLVFLYDAERGGYTSGERCIDNETFFARLGQRVIHILNTATAGGVLYQVDMRLRPSGNSGMLVSSLEAYEKYQRNKAWTWEHQALVRARPVAGDPALGKRFGQVRHDILVQPREAAALRREVIEMRRKMIDHLGSGSDTKAAGRFDLKQDPGGIVDIEFMVQFAVLAQAHNYPNLTRWSDNIRILAQLAECGILTEQVHRQLVDAYIVYRSAGHRLQLQQAQSVVAGDEFADQRLAVQAAWQQVLGGGEEPQG